MTFLQKMRILGKAAKEVVLSEKGRDLAIAIAVAYINHKLDKMPVAPEQEEKKGDLVDATEKMSKVKDISDSDLWNDNERAKKFYDSGLGIVDKFNDGGDAA